jgi:hypothetical protein
MRAITILLCLMAVTLVNAEVCSKAVSSGDSILLDKKTTVGELALYLGANALEIVKLNKLGNGSDNISAITIDSGEVIQIPNSSPTSVVEKKIKTKAKIAVSKRVDAKKLFYCSSSTSVVEEHIGATPFSIMDYTKCVYEVSAVDVSMKVTLAKVAKNFHSPALRVLRFNEGLDLNSPLFEGQKIRIPDWDFTYWCYVNRAPVGKRTLEELKTKIWPCMRFFKKYPQLIEVMAEKYAANKYFPSSIKSGEMFEQWMSCIRHGKAETIIVDDNGVAALSGDSTPAAKRFDLNIPGTDSVKIIKEVDVCFNWTIAQGIEEVPPTNVPVATPEEPVVPQKPDTNSSDEWGLGSADTQKIVTVAAAAPEPTIVTWKAREDYCLSDNRPLNSGFFDRRGAQYAGARLDVMRNTNQSRNSVGLSISGGLYDGGTGSGFGYYGGMASISPLLILSLSPQYYWGFEIIGIGVQGNWNTGTKNYQYDAYQSNLYLRHGQTLDAMWVNNHLSIWASVDWAFGAQKQSTRQGIQTVQSGTSNHDSLDAVSDNSGADGGACWYFLRKCAVEPLVVYRTAYATSDNARTNAAGIGLAFWNETLVLEFGIQNRSASIWDDNNGNTFYTMLRGSFGDGRGRKSN